MSRYGVILVAFIALGLSGCSWLTPYKSSFQCPDVDKGKCVTVKEAYRQSFLPAKRTDGAEKDTDAKDAREEAEGSDTRDNGKDTYKENLQEELANLIKDPVTPVVLPPKVIRVLIFPYPDKNLLFMPRYVYMMVDEPEWVIGNYLIEGRD